MVIRILVVYLCTKTGHFLLFFMITTKISIKPHLAEYVRGRFGTNEGYIRFPDRFDIYHTIFDLTEKRPKQCRPDTGNIEIILPDRREGKSPKYYNYLSARSQRIIERKIEFMFWAEVRSHIDCQYHTSGLKYIESIGIFMGMYGIESITEDALQKNYYRWRKKMLNLKKRAYFSKKNHRLSVSICPLK